MRLRAFSWAVVAAVLALVTLTGSADTVRAQATFNPELAISLENPTAETASNFTGTFDLPEGDVNFAAVVAYIPPEWGIVTGDWIPVGAKIGELRADSVLGLTNGPCNTQLPVVFDMKNGLIDTTDTVPFDDIDENNTNDFADDDDQNGEFDGIDKYPEFLNRLFPDLQPIRRAAGVTPVAGIPILLQFLIFPPGTEIDPLIPSDPELGFPSVTVLQNIGDDEVQPEPSIINDFCSPLATENDSYGTTEDGEWQVLVNPTDGVYTFTTLGLGQRDADGDTYENSLDTCALVPNVGNPRVPSSGDLDFDGLDAACDPNDDTATGTNSDEDNDGYQNRQDNCPLDANGQAEDNQHDEDEDQIGDACDPDPETPNGEYIPAQPTFDVTIGAGGSGPGSAPSEAACEHCWRDDWVFEGHQAGSQTTPKPTEPSDGGTPTDTGEVTPSPEPDGGDEDDDGGGSGTVIAIVVGVIAAVVVIGGGAALLMRRRGA